MYAIMRNPFLIVLVILMIPITPVVMLGFVAITLFAAIYSIFREVYEEIFHAGHYGQLAKVE